MFRDAVVTATFVAQPPSDVWLEVRKEGTGGGSIEGLGIQCGSDCSEGYAPGTPLVLEARPAQGSVFKGWDGCQVTRGTQCFLAPQADRVVTATFNRLIILGKVPGDGSAPGPALGVGHVRVAATPGGVAGAR